MLKLHPNCECCDKNLPPESIEENICSYECTFCTECVEGILKNVYPNCGGEFVPRPVRPKTERRSGVSLYKNPASTKRINTQYTRDELILFCDSVKNIAAEER